MPSPDRHQYTAGSEGIEAFLHRPFRPFEGAPQNLPAETNLGVSEIMHLLPKPINFRGIKGAAYLMADGWWGDTETDQVSSNYVTTPLGEPAIIKVVRDGKLMLTQTPLEFRLDFMLTAPEQYLSLASHVLKIDCGGEIFYCDLAGWEWVDDHIRPEDLIPSTEVPEHIVKAIENEGEYFSANFFLRDVQGRFVSPLLPYNPQQLEHLEGTFIPLQESRPQTR